MKDFQSLALQCMTDVRFTEGGREYPNLDCYGLVAHMLHKTYGIQLETLPDEVANRDLGGYWGDTISGWTEVEEPEGGNVVFMKTGRFYHLAFCLSGKQCIHIAKGYSGCVVDRIADLHGDEVKFYAYRPN